MSLADRIVVMDGGPHPPGRARPAEVYDRPADLFVASFVGSPGMNFIRGEVAGTSGRALFVSETGQVRARRPARRRRARVSSGQATLGIRCEHVHEDASGPIAGRVRDRGVPRQRAQRPRRARRAAGSSCAPTRRRRTRSDREVRLASTCRRSRSSTARRRRGCDRRIIDERDAGAARRPRRARRGAVPEPRAASASASARPRRCEGIDLEAGRDELLVVLGPTGAGKTTLLRTIAGLERPDAGTITMAGRDVTALGPGRARRRAGVPELLALPALDRCGGTSSSRCARPGATSPKRRSSAASPGRPSCSASRATSIARPRGCRAARCSAWRSAARSCAGRGCS